MRSFCYLLVFSAFDFCFLMCEAVRLTGSKGQVSCGWGLQPSVAGTLDESAALVNRLSLDR